MDYLNLATFAEKPPMEFLLVSATAMEIRPLLQRMSLAGSTTGQLSAYRYHGVKVDVLIPGAGMVATAFHLGGQLARKRYDLAVNAGIAGAFDPTLPIGTVVQVVSDCIPELGAEDGESFLSLFDLGLADPDRSPYHGGRLENDLPDGLPPAAVELIARIPRVSGITSNTVRGNESSIARIRQMAPAGVESMEGAAFFYGCLSAGIPCLQIRSLSNYVEERDKSKWNLDLSLKNLNHTLHQLLSACAG